LVARIAHEKKLSKGGYIDESFERLKNRYENKLANGFPKIPLLLPENVYDEIDAVYTGSYIYATAKYMDAEEKVIPELVYIGVSPKKGHF
jgi:hypothetical protein